MARYTAAERFGAIAMAILLAGLVTLVICLKQCTAKQPDPLAVPPAAIIEAPADSLSTDNNKSAKAKRHSKKNSKKKKTSKPSKVTPPTPPRKSPLDRPIAPSNP